MTQQQHNNALFVFVCFVPNSPKHQSPWYDLRGWLGVKQQLSIYLPKHQHREEEKKDDHIQTTDWDALKATLGNFLRDVVERLWAFPGGPIPSWTELNWLRKRNIEENRVYRLFGGIDVLLHSQLFQTNWIKLGETSVLWDGGREHAIRYCL